MKIWKQLLIHVLIILSCMCWMLTKIDGAQSTEVETTVLEDEEKVSYQGTVESKKTKTSSPQEEEVVAEAYITEESESELPQYQIFTEDECYELAKLAECEGGNQNIQTRILILYVVYNRINSESFPDTVHEVIYECHDGVYQFSPLCEGGSWYNTEPSDDSYEAVAVFQEQLYNDINNSGGALYFEAFGTDAEAESSWHARNLQFLYKSQDTRFYK